MGRRHGLSKSREYGIRNQMIQRCHNPKATGFDAYGGKGITVCDEWRNDFMSFYLWAHENGYSDTLTIDRKDPQKGYNPENCRWITQHEQVLSQKRNSHRKPHYRYINRTSTGYSVRVMRNVGGKNTLLFSINLDTMIEATVARDYYVFTGNIPTIDMFIDHTPLKKIHFGDNARSKRSKARANLRREHNKSDKKKRIERTAKKVLFNARVSPTLLKRFKESVDMNTMDSNYTSGIISAMEMYIDESMAEKTSVIRFLVWRKDEIIADLNKGLSISKLAKHYQVSDTTMYKALKEWGAIDTRQE